MRLLSARPPGRSGENAKGYSPAPYSIQNTVFQYSTALTAEPHMHSTIQYSSTVQYVYSIQYSTVQNSPVMYSTVFSNSEQSAMRCRKVALVSFVFLFHQHSLSTATAMILSGVTNVPLSTAATHIHSNHSIRTPQYSLAVCPQKQRPL